MEAQKSPTDSVKTSSDLFDLNLPRVARGEGPEPLPEPSYELVRQHALFLLSAQDDKAENQIPNPEPFVLD